MATANPITHQLSRRFISIGYGPPNERHEPVASHPREGQTRRAAGGREKRTFGQELPNYSRAPGAEREADGDFLAARAGTGQQHVRDICAGDEQYERGDAEQGPQHRKQDLSRAPLVHMLDQDALFIPAVGARNNAGDLFHLGPRLLDRPARREAGERLHRLPATIGELIARGKQRLDGKGNEDVEHQSDVEPAETRRRHADDGEPLPLSVNSLPMMAGSLLKRRFQ
jgi:hypothetical protein